MCFQGRKMITSLFSYVSAGENSSNKIYFLGIEIQREEKLGDEYNSSGHIFVYAIISAMMKQKV